MWNSKHWIEGATHAEDNCIDRPCRRLVVTSVPAFAVNGDSSSYGTQGYGPTVPTQSLTPFQRSWNHANESKERARAGAAWIRKHGGIGHVQPQ